MAIKHSSLLVVEDDLDVAEMLNAYFQVQGYQVIVVNTGEEAVNACQASRPDLVILDIRLPDIDGYEVAHRLRGNRRTDDIPIIFLTEKRNRADRLQGLELGADDYITKPFDVQELRLRVRNALRRSQQGALSNPVTNLPEGALVDERLSECLTNKQWAMVKVQIGNLEHFRDAYGFVVSDDVVRAISMMVHNAMRELGNPNDFMGQVGPAEFVLVTSPDTVSALGERIRSRLEQAIDYFYPIGDRGRGDLPARRLKVQMRKLLASQGPFKDLQALKTALQG